MRFPRAGGVLVHPTSFPSPYGIGDLGQGAYDFIDFLGRSRQSVWQILPLGPTGYGDSPYQSFSAFAGNPLLISPALLLRDGYLPDPLPLSVPSFPADRVDFGAVISWKRKLFDAAFQRFQDQPPKGKAAAFESFCQHQSAWLDDFALFMALKERHADHEGGVWNTWPKEIARRQPRALKRWSKELAGEIALEKFKQFLFFEQWLALKHYAHQWGVRIVGDVPIFVAYDSADVWANPHIFYLDVDGAPTVVAGVPPDYFSATGQRWGNPLYRWETLATYGYAWWAGRLRATFTQVDVVRIDHFRGFDAYWEIPASEPTAVVGRWVKGPGSDFFEAMRRELGDLPIIAEDLGVITPAVEALRDDFSLPGMKILQFAFGGERNSNFLPHNFDRNCVVYTGTHDNETTSGWYGNATTDEQDHVRRYVARDGSDIAWDMIRLAYASVADTAVVPIQDLMSLGNEARMNFPGKTGGWWTWRYRPETLTDAIANRLAEITELFGRAPRPASDDQGPRYEIDVEDA
jgi:4-alpha-glucanotransferase